uniref:Uncharacterized protein n=1 Tax=Chromera velia CCMP2878 TaxID=1169474 RepID=A0A0G4HL25_9ALVE|eukprot:Cvel_7301.t1-p1 / transcript=Cvel_7301.t1 / gene=Cvel_7301 / organism=Chromera_velia_CCMP2878 / gene_product=hypothetical protein / transcript_product=hypothetical protein / location=Cvel_scaffold377:88113-90122(-) / protein_length=392 / sequence_SO=supercontig / SO=protein_coding / is_pseudo=false
MKKVRVPAFAFFLFVAHISSSATDFVFPESKDLSEYVDFPGGLQIHRDCIHRTEPDNVAETDSNPPLPFWNKRERRLLSRSTPNSAAATHTVSSPPMTDLLHTPCPFPVRRRKSVTEASEGNAAETGGTKPSGLGYYSTWVAYASFTSPTPLTNFTSEWTVPPLPPHRNPLTTTFFFNGIEDKVPGELPQTYIIQPVLQTGQSGCLPFGFTSKWHFTSYYVNAGGRAFCGKVLPVSEGDRLVGRMFRLDGGDGDGVSRSNAERWRVEGEVLNRPKQKTTVIDVDLPIGTPRWAALSMEVIRCYSCGAYPANEKVLFEQPLLEAVAESEEDREEEKETSETGGGRVRVTPSWEVTVTHDECGQAVELLGESEGHAVAIRYQSGENREVSEELA